MSDTDNTVKLKEDMERAARRFYRRLRAYHAYKGRSAAKKLELFEAFNAARIKYDAASYKYWHYAVERPKMLQMQQYLEKEMLERL